MLRAETIHPAELDPADAQAWRAMCAGEPAFASPLLGPDFAAAVARVRDDARVTVWRDGDRPVGFLPHHRRPGAFARPIGAPLSDYHALVGEPGLNLAEALAAADLTAFRFAGLLDPYGAFERHVTARQPGFRIELQTTAEDYLEALRVASPKRFKNWRRLDHKLDREAGPLRIAAPDRSRAAFDTLMTWKREQLARTGAHDFLHPDWTRELIGALFELREGDFRGLMICLYAGDRLVGGHFGVRLGSVFHPWIASIDPALAAWSPGQLFLPRAIAAMPDLGLTDYDLGPGHEHYKRPFAPPSRTVAEGLAAAESAAGRAAQAAERAWMLVGGSPGGPLDRVRRRLDAIATVELSVAGRARSLAAAVVAGTRRSQAEPA
ncbi:GNAT family N-acetyltransferase [Phenylobacterium sp.]|uniref:GNAT family N-acetyltransferase n=1 Tax=Phenylobacterium sp. TaxID=1871053 RepID=UPI002F407872